MVFTIERFLVNTFMWKIMFGLIVLFTAADGGLMKYTVAAVRRRVLCGSSKQRYFFSCMSLTEITVKSSFSVCIFPYCSPNQYRVPTKIVHVLN